MKPGIKTAFRSAAIVVIVIVFSSYAQAQTNGVPACTEEVLKTAQMFNCDPQKEPVPPVKYGPASTYNDANARGYFADNWRQLGYEQRHNPVFSIDEYAPAFLQDGTFWAAPLTGDGFLRLAEGFDSYPPNGGQSWASTVAAALGNVMGVSVVQGIVYVQLSSREIYALDAKTGEAIWRKELVNVAGMGQTIVEEIAGRPVVFVPAGDAAFTVKNVIDFTKGLPHDRGADFSSLYAFDGLTGEQLWRFDTKGAARPAPVYKDGKLYLPTGGGEMHILDAATGMRLGTFTNPGEGFTGLASPNWYMTEDNKLFILYGTLRPRRILAVDVTDPVNPTLGWQYSPPRAAANSPGDTPVGVDQDLGVVMTAVFTSAPEGGFYLNVIALNAATGEALWMADAGHGPNIPGFKASVPLIHEGNVYLGNSLNETYQSYEIATGNLRWATSVQEDDDAPAQRHRAAAAGVFYQGKIIHAEGRDIRVFDPDTGEILNDFESPGSFAAWAVIQPVIVGNMMYLGSISGWVFAAPADYIMISPGFGQRPFPPTDQLNPQEPEFLNASALPAQEQAARFPKTWLAYAGGQDHNGYNAHGPRDVSWQAPLDWAVPLDARPGNEDLFGTEIATQMMHYAFGVGSGVSPARGILYAGSDRGTVNALNAMTGELIWKFKTFNGTFGQPLATPNTVVATSGDPWLALGSTGRFRSNSPATIIGGSFEYLVGLDPMTGVEKWNFFTGTGTDAMTPLYHEGNLYWVDGDAKVWAINADTAEPVAPFIDANGKPILTLGGFNVHASANIHRRTDGETKGADIMIVGTAMPNKVTGIDLATAQVLWTQDLAGFTTYVTGFAAVPPAVDQVRGIVIGTVLVDEDTETNTIMALAYGLNARTGAVVWTRSLGRGMVPTGFAGPTAVLHKKTAYIANPLTKTVLALDTLTGAIQWQTSVEMPDGMFSWGPGVVVKKNLIQPLGPDLATFDIDTGELLHRMAVGGSFTYNSPTVVGSTLYIGNSWGWVSAFPVDVVTGASAP